MKSAWMVGLLVAAGTAQAVEIYNNGPVVNGSGLSVLTSPSTTLGFASVAASGFTLADDFTVPAGQTWNIASIDFFAYQTSAGGYTFTNVA